MRTRTLLIWVAPAVVASLVLFLGLGAAQAGKHVAVSPVKGPRHGFVAPHVGVAGMKITGSLVAVGASLVVKAGGFAAVDSPQTLKCKPVGGCTFEATMMVQFDSGSEGYAPGKFAICLVVDSVIVTDCLYLGVAPANGFYTAETAVAHTSGLSQGNHTVQTQLYTENPTKIWGYDITYRAYNQ